MRKLGGVALVVGVLTFSACSGAQRDADPAAPVTAGTATTTVRPQPTTTTSTPEFSFDDSVPPPKLINTGTNYVAILKSLEAYGNWLGAHRPDPSLAATSVAGGTRLLRDYIHDITLLRDNNKREIERRTGPTTITILSATPNAFSARVVEEISVHQIVDAAGVVSSERRFQGQTVYVDIVVREHGRWRLADVRVQS